MLQGEVNDENAYSLEGVAGHAGLFGTAGGIYKLLQIVWAIAKGDSTRPLASPSLVRRFLERQTIVPGSTWALGFDTPSEAHSSAGAFFSPRSAGHLGFTGTSFWMDLEQEILVILLTNRVYPSRTNDQIKSFRPLLHDAVMKAFYEHSGS